MACSPSSFSSPPLLLHTAIPNHRLMCLSYTHTRPSPHTAIHSKVLLCSPPKTSLPLARSFTVSPVPWISLTASPDHLMSLLHHTSIKQTQQPCRHLFCTRYIAHFSHHAVFVLTSDISPAPHSSIKTAILPPSLLCTECKKLTVSIQLYSITRVGSIITQQCLSLVPNFSCQQLFSTFYWKACVNIVC